MTDQNIAPTDLKADGDDDSICPRCGDSDITGGSVDIESGGAYQRCTCAACGAVWTNAYDFAGSYLDSDGEPEGESDGTV